MTSTLCVAVARLRPAFELCSLSACRASAVSRCDPAVEPTCEVFALRPPSRSDTYSVGSACEMLSAGTTVGALYDVTDLRRSVSGSSPTRRDVTVFLERPEATEPAGGARDGTCDFAADMLDRYGRPHPQKPASNARDMPRMSALLATRSTSSEDDRRLALTCPHAIRRLTMHNAYGGHRANWQKGKASHAVVSPIGVLRCSMQRLACHWTSTPHIRICAYSL